MNYIIQCCNYHTCMSCITVHELYNSVELYNTVELYTLNELYTLYGLSYSVYSS